jgi:hypothetical protein
MYTSQVTPQEKSKTFLRSFRTSSFPGLETLRYAITVTLLTLRIEFCDSLKHVIMKQNWTAHPLLKVQLKHVVHIINTIMYHVSLKRFNA